MLLVVVAVISEGEETPTELEFSATSCELDSAITVFESVSRDLISVHSFEVIGACEESDKAYNQVVVAATMNLASEGLPLDKLTACLSSETFKRYRSRAWNL